MLGAVLLRSEGAVLLKSRRSIPEAVGGGTTEESNAIKEYASAYAQMKPKEAAGIFEEMTDNLELVSRILMTMNAQQRGDILGQMDPAVAAKLTKIMDPES